MINRKVSLLKSELQLELPFFFADDKLHKAAVVDFPSKFHWNDDEIYDLHDGMLRHYLKFLDDGRASESMKKDVIDWVESTDVAPFSFETCCLCAGCDPTELRGAVKGYLARSK